MSKFLLDMRVLLISNSTVMKPYRKQWMGFFMYLRLRVSSIVFKKERKNKRINTSVH